MNSITKQGVYGGVDTTPALWIGSTAELKDSILREAGSFVPHEIRERLAGERPERAEPRPAVVLSCDISGFSALSQTFLSRGVGGVDALHTLLNAHFNHLLDVIVAQGGQPLFFFGDALLAMWDASDRSTAARSAIRTAENLANADQRSDDVLGLNYHVSYGTLQLVEVGGSQDQWHIAAIGTAMSELQRIGTLRAPNRVIATKAVLEGWSGSLKQTEIPGARDAVILDQSVFETDQSSMLPYQSIPAVALPQAMARAPRPVHRWLSSVGLEWLAEERPVTAILTTLDDFDQSSADAAHRLAQVVLRVQTCVHTYGGDIDNVMIDDKGASILSVFGVPPDAHSDDPVRAVQAALDIQTSLTALRERHMIAVTTGLAFCALVGNDSLRGYMVVGDVVTRASRMCGAMSPDQGVLADGPTQRASEGLIGVTRAPIHLSLKGHDAPTPAWPVPRRSEWTVQDRSISGRDVELDRLRRLWSAARDGSTSSALIIEGEAGTGKTTLAMALRDIVVREKGRFLASTSTPIQASSPFSGIRTLASEALGLNSTMDEAERQATLVDALPLHSSALAPLLEAVVPSGLQDTEETAKLTGMARATALEDLLCEIFVVAFGQGATCLCFEDAMWLDAESERLLDRVSRTAPALLILALRQTDATRSGPDLGRPSALRWPVLTLGALDQEGLAALICSRLGSSEADLSLVQRISEISDGHPFFASEILQSFVDRGKVFLTGGVANLDRSSSETEIPFPRTLYGAVLQRLDRLEPESQMSLRSASVVGLSFSLALAVATHPLSVSPAVADGHYAEHVQRGFLDVLRSEAEPGYSFRHGIVRDVAYSQVPIALRRDLHGKIAGWLEEQYGGAAVLSLTELAHHWGEAGEIGKSIDFLGQEAARVFSQGFANSAVELGFQALGRAGVEIPKDEAGFGAAIQENLAEIAKFTGDQTPSDMVQDLRGEADTDTALKIQALGAISPFAFQSNQFGVFAWAGSTALRLALRARSGNPDILSFYSVIVSALTGNRAAGAEWSRAALLLDAAQGGHRLAAAGFVDTWFHAHWRDPIGQSPMTNRASAAKAKELGDYQYASYNIAGEVVLMAATGLPLPDVMEVASSALAQPMLRNSAMQVHLEMQMARALRGETESPTSLSSPGVDEEATVSWVLGTEFANQIGYLCAAKVRLHRHAGDWHGAVAAAEQATPALPAISGQTAEFDLVFHRALACVSLLLEEADDAAKLEETASADAALFETWARIQPANFANKAAILSQSIAGFKGSRVEAAEALTALAAEMVNDPNLQDRAVALEYAAQLDPISERVEAAVAAYQAWGATAVADRVGSMI